MSWLFLTLAGCTSIPDSYAPPMQRRPWLGPEPSAVKHFVNMNDPDADSYIVRDISRTVEGSWRWTYARPELRFHLATTQGLKFTADLSIAEVTLRQTGPVTLSFLINGHLLDKVHYSEHGEKHVQKPVPPGYLALGENRVVIEPDKTWVSNDDKVRLGFILTRAGFVQ